MLDIIVTHYDEPWHVGRRFFDMLGCQRGIRFSDIHVILVHDGTQKFPESYFSRYPYVVTQYEIPHKGVSAARNYGIDMATEKWVQFCDFDDMYSYAYALYSILDIMQKKDVDYMWTPFVTEYYVKGKLEFKIKNEENFVWIHGKYFRLEWLRENNLRFPEHLYYSEDSAFCAVVNEIAKIGRRGKIKLDFPSYAWIYRTKSVTTDPANEERNMVGFMERNFWVVEEYKRRGIQHEAMVARMFADAYYAFHKKGVDYSEHERAFAERAKAYMDDFRANDDETIRAILNAAWKPYDGKAMVCNETFEVWLDRIMSEGE